MPFGEVTPFQGSLVLRYQDGRESWFLEYELKFADDTERIAPLLLTTISPGALASFEGYSRHSLRGGYSFQDSHPVRLTLGVENLTDELYFTAYSGAPAPGRSWIVGLSYRWHR